MGDEQERAASAAGGCGPAWPGCPLPLRRARAADLDALVSLQRTAYAKNWKLLGVEPLPLLADYSEILRTMEVWLADGRGARGRVDP